MNRTCESCHAPLLKKRNPSGRIESPKRFAARRFCSYSCSSARLMPNPRSEMIERIREMATSKSSGQMAVALGISRNTVIGLADRNNIALQPPVRVAEEDRREKRNIYERDRRRRLAAQHVPKPRKIHTYRKPGRLVAMMQWGGHA